jgi:ferric-dicitrate binding protein FerR (iron transport regulator)
MMDNQRLHFLLKKLETQTASLAEQQEIDEFYQSFDKQPNYTDSVTNLKEYEQFNALKMSSAIHESLTKRKDIKLKYWIGTAAALLVVAFGFFFALRTTTPHAFEALTTSRGETRQVQLPDGSLVTLNAASTLKYAVNFLKLKQRIVELSGEAYFEVTKDKKHPFIVKTAHQKIEVLGTRFNVSAYKEDKSTITTLFEGSIKIFYTKNNASQALIPGQKAVLNGGTFSIGTTKVENDLAWKNGVFCFDNDSLQSVMNKISRWYDVDIVYLGKIESYEETFNGRISKSVDLQRILRIIEQVGQLQFTVKEHKIIVKLIK